MNFVSGIIQNSISGFVDAGMRSAGGFAGDTLIKAGDAIESAGRGYGNGVSGKFENWGDSIKSYSGAPKPAVNKPKANTTGSASGSRPKTIQRSNSSPVASKPKSSVPARTATVSQKSTVVKKSASSARPAVQSTNSTPGSKRYSQINKVSTGEIKYTPGVGTGMPKTSATKPLNNQAKKPAGGEIKYTPGKITGMPGSNIPKTPIGSKGAALPSKPPAKDEKPTAGANKNGVGPKIDRSFF